MASMAYTNGNGTYSNGEDNLTSSALLQRYNQNLDLSVRVGDLYQLSIKNYLNKNFNKSWDLIVQILGQKNEGPHISEQDEYLVLKIYKLYLSLYDLLLKKEFQVPNSAYFEDLFKRGELYKEVVDSGINDPELYLIVFILEIANGLSLATVSEQMSLYLLSHDNDDKDKFMIKIFKLYVFNVLAPLDYEKGTNESEEFVNRYLFREDDVVKLEFLDKLKKVKKDIVQEKKQQKAQEEAKEEERRLLKRKEKERELSLNAQRDFSSHESSSPAVTTDITHINPSVNTTTSTSNVRRKLKNLVRRLGIEHLGVNNNGLMLLLLLIGFLISIKKNKTLVLNTLKMVFKITYI